MTRREDQGGCRARSARICGVVLAAVLSLSIGVERTPAETQLVIDPTEVPEPPNPDASTTKKPAKPDARLRRERKRAEEEQRKRAKAEARALAAENEAAKLRAMEQARQADAAAKDAAAKAAARKAAAGRAAAARAAAAKMTRARIAAEKAAAEKEAAARQAAARELAARETAAKELEAREAAAREAAAREAAAREAAATEAAAREATAREVAAREAAAREAAAREAAAREMAAREAAAREASAREAAAREAAAKLAAAMDAAAREARASRAQSRFRTVFRDCAYCPELVWLPQGEFIMGEAFAAASGPRHVVRISYMLAVGRFEVTFAEWDACVAAGGCRRRPDDSGWGRGRQPVINVSWADAQQYAAWLARRTSKHYRLLTEAEWEYAARAGSDVAFWWGNRAGHGEANCYDCGSRWDGRQAAPVGRFFPNPFGLYDMHGNVSEWVEDCYHDRYRDAPSDGTAWTLDCTAISDTRMVRGGAWHGHAITTRSAARSSASFDYYDNRIGFRIARTE